jgi:hypothetical protein
MDREQSTGIFGGLVRQYDLGGFHLGAALC